MKAPPDWITELAEIAYSDMNEPTRLIRSLRTGAVGAEWRAAQIQMIESYLMRALADDRARGGR